jgi:hypothetical protein
LVPYEKNILLSSLLPQARMLKKAFFDSLHITQFTKKKLLQCRRERKRKGIGEDA